MENATPTKAPQAFSVEQACDYARSQNYPMSRAKLYRLLAAGEVTGFLANGRRRINRRYWRQWVRDRLRHPGGPRGARRK